MKHSLKITLILLATFLLAQFIGLAIVYQYIDVQKTAEIGKTAFKQLPIGERPQLQEETSYLPIMIAILLGTLILFFLMKYDLYFVWKLWFLLAVTVALTTAFGSFLSSTFALALAFILALWKIFKPNLWVQTATELFIYGGLAAIFVPVLNLLSVSILIILIAAYDAYAVWRSKHMITLAQSQTKAKVFAGLLIPYALPGRKPSPKLRKPPVEMRTALLGGGDIGFPLIFAGVMIKELSLWQGLLIPFFATAGLAFLLWHSDEKKFYPAMPFIGAGCFLGLAVVYLIGLL